MHHGFENPRPPILIDSVFDDPGQMRALVRQNGPYWPTLRYVANPTELSAFGTQAKKMSVPPWFRGDWANGEALVEGATEILENKHFIEAAHQIFEAEVVRPTIVYVNVMGPMGAGPAHIDVPAFRGIDRSEYPVTFLHLMHRSGLFEASRVEIATAVAWFYDGTGGAFQYWPDGASGAAQRIEGPLNNRAVVGDNERMFHRVEPIGGDSRPAIEGATLDVELVPSQEDQSWSAIDAGAELLRYEDRDVRISISWKAEVFRDAEAAAVRAEHTDDLPLDTVVARFLEDLRARASIVNALRIPFETRPSCSCSTRRTHCRLQISDRR